MSIVESVPISDDALCSAIGNSYGDIYETHLKWAREARINQSENEVHKAFKEYMMPILKGKM